MKDSPTPDLVKAARELAALSKLSVATLSAIGIGSAGEAIDCIASVWGVSPIALHDYAVNQGVIKTIEICDWA